MNQGLKSPGDRLPLLITIGVFVVMLLCLPLVLRMDEGLDRERPMYADMVRMENMQTLNIANGGRPVEADLSGGDTVEVGAQEFVTSPGVRLVVRATDKNSYCIRVSNEFGAKSSEHCSP